MGEVCTACGGVDTLELELASGTLACNKCGTVSQSSSTASFEFLARVDDEDESTGGRMYVSERNQAWGGGLAASGVRALGGRASQWAGDVGERRNMFHAKKKNEADNSIRRMLQRFDSASRYRTACTLFETMKAALGFTWGYRAEVYAAACVYVAIRQTEREIWIQDIMDCCDSIKEPVHLSRAIRLIKLENNIRTTDLDPILFVERVLVHLQKVVGGDSPTYHSAKQTKPFSKKNLEWIRGLSLEQARTLAISLLAFSRQLFLVHGRAPEQVACGVVMVALEGVARRACPKAQEFDDEMAWLTNTAAFTIQERQREYTAALAAYAPKLPWVANKAKKWKKGQVVEHTRDILQFWKALDTKERKEKAKREEDEKQARAKLAGTSQLGEDEGEDDDGIDHAVFDAQAGGEGGFNFDDDEGYSTEGAVSLPGDLGFADPLQARTDPYAWSPEPESKASSGKRVRSNQDIVAKRPGVYIRGANEWNRTRAAQEAIAKGFGPALSPGLDGYSSDGATSSPPLAAVADSTTPAMSRSSSAVPAPVADPGIVAQFQAYGSKPEAVRAQLAPGLPRKSVTARRGDSRLDKLLWEKSVDDILDDELFDDGELDSYLRSDAEAEFVRRLPQYAEMIKVSLEQESKPKQPARPRRRVRGQPNPEFVKLQGEARAKGVKLTTILKARMKRERGEDDGEGGGGGGGFDGQKEFRPRNKKTKVNAEAKARLAALLAQGSDDEQDGDEGAAQGTDEWVRVAMNAAGQVDSGVVEVEGAIEDEDEVLDHQGGDEDDWRKEFQYGTVDSDGYEDE